MKSLLLNNIFLHSLRLGHQDQPTEELIIFKPHVVIKSEERWQPHFVFLPAGNSLKSVLSSEQPSEEGYYQKRLSLDISGRCRGGRAFCGFPPKTSQITRGQVKSDEETWLVWHGQSIWGDGHCFPAPGNCHMEGRANVFFLNARIRSKYLGQIP